MHHAPLLLTCQAMSFTTEGFDKTCVGVHEVWLLLQFANFVLILELRWRRGQIPICVVLLNDTTHTHTHTDTPSVRSTVCTVRYQAADAVHPVTLLESHKALTQVDGCLRSLYIMLTRLRSAFVFGTVAFLDVVNQVGNAAFCFVQRNMIASRQGTCHPHYQWHMDETNKGLRWPHRG